MIKEKPMTPEKIAEISILAGVIDKEVMDKIKAKGLVGDIASVYHSATFFPAMDGELKKRKMRL